MRPRGGGQNSICKPAPVPAVERRGKRLFDVASIRRYLAECSTGMPDKKKPPQLAKATAAVQTADEKLPDQQIAQKRQKARSR